MDSVVGDDPTLPVNFEESEIVASNHKQLENNANMAGLPDVTTGPDITAANFSDHFPDGNMPAIQKISSGRMSPIRAHTMKDYEQQISELKKENFSLKLRIYFMEERIEQNFDDDTKTNIELRVEIESLKKDLMEKQQLLVKASNAVESLAHEKDALTDKLRQENNQALTHQRERLELALQQARQECESVKRANEILQKRLAEAKSQAPQEDKQQDTAGLQQAHNQAMEEKDRQIEDLTSVLQMKDATISQLEAEKEYAVDEKLEPLQQEVQQLKRTLDNKNAQLQAVKNDLDKEKGEGRNRDRQYEDAFKEQERRLKDLEESSEHMQQELKNKDKEIKDLQNTLRKAEQEKKDLEQEVVDKDKEIKTYESNTMKRDKAIQGLAEAIKSKDKEIRLLCDQADERENALTQAREAMHKAQKNKYEGMEQYQAAMSDMESKLAEQRGKLHSKQLENERLEKSLARKQQEVDRLRHDGNEAEQHLNDLLEQRELTVKELKGQLQDAKLSTDDKVDAIEQHYQGLLEDSHQQLQNKDKIIQRLTKGIQDKDRLVKEYMELARDANKPTHDDNGGNSALIQTLRERLKQRDKAVEEALEEKLQAVEAKEAEVRQLRSSLRDRDKDLERAQSDNLANQDKLNHLQSELKEKEAHATQLGEALDAQKQANKDAGNNQRRALSERDSIIKKLRQSLDANEKIMAEMQDAKRREDGDIAKERDEVIEQLKRRLRDKDKMLEEVLAERSQAAAANEKATQDLLDTIKDKDNQIKELHERQNRLTASKNNVIKDLQKELNDKEYSVQAAEDTLCRAEQEQAMLLNKMRASMADKDKTIQKLIESGREKDRLFRELQQSAANQSPSPTVMAELANLRDKNDGLKKTLREKEAALRELQQSDQPDAGFMESLRTELDNKNKLLAKAKNTIDSLQKEQQAEKQTKQEMGKLRRQIIELESEVQAKQDHIDALIHAGKVKDNIIKEIRLDQASVPIRTAAMGGEDGSNQLQQILQDQMRELGRLSDALRAERQLYVNITQSGAGEGSPRPRSPDSLTIELAAVQALRRQLEDGIRRNDAMREQLERQMNQAEPREMSPRTAALQSKEMQTLRNQLEDSSRWNASLQSRLDEMRQRVGGVGMDVDPDDQTSSLSQASDSEQLPRKTIPELQREVAQLKNHLQESEQRRQSLEDALDRQEVESLRSIPGQEEDSTRVAQTNAYQKRIQELERRLAESEQEKQSAKQQLEAALLNQSRGDEEEGPVVAILKQQLDQAKTLLQEKDRQLQQKEQQNQTLRHHLGIGPDSPIHPGRSMLATLHQENSRLQQDGQDLVEKNQALAKQLQSLQAQFNKLRQVNSALQQQLESPPEGKPLQDDHLVPLLKNQLDQAKALIQEKDQQNQILREILRIGPDAPPEEGKDFIEKLQKRNQHLKSKLNQALQGSEDTRAELESLTRELEHLKQATPRSINPEIGRLQKQLRNAQNLNELLKKHIDLNSSQDSEEPSFNPELIVDMAKEIERLQDQLSEAQDKLKVAPPSEGHTEVDKGRSPVRVPSGDVNALTALRQELHRTQAELDELKRRYRTLQVKLQATEGTVHHQADRINRYRREMHNAGLAPPSTPKRVHSDSNLLHSTSLRLSSRGMSGSNLSMFLLEEGDSSTSTSPCPSERGGLDDVSFSEFGKTDNVDDLKEQIALLKNQVDRYKRIIRHLQRRLRSEERSRSPNRAPSPMSDTSSSGWFELTANQDAFERLKQEVENLRVQLQETSDANATLKNMNNELQEQLQVVDAASATRGRCISDEMLKAQEGEVEHLKKQLHDSQTLCEMLKAMLNEALGAMEEVMEKHGAGTEKGSDISPGKISNVRYKMQKSRDLTEKLSRVLEEPIQSTKVTFVDVSTRPLYLDSMEAKDKDIARLKKELKDRKELNHKLRDLLTDNQRVADETRQDLQRLSKEVEEKNEKISELHSQLRDSIRASARRAPSGDRQHPAEASDLGRDGHRQGLFEFDEGDVDIPDFGWDGKSREREPRGLAAGRSEPLTSTQKPLSSSRTKAVSTQTVPTQPIISSHDSTTPELTRLRSKVRDTERLNSALRAELEIYKSVIGDADIGIDKGRGDGKQDPNDVLKEHLEELRELRRKLEESIRVNFRLREQLEAKLADMGQKEEGTTIIHLEQTNIELTERNNSLKKRLVEKDCTIQDLRDDLQQTISLKLKLNEKDRTIQDLQYEVERANLLNIELNKKDRTIQDLRDELQQTSSLKSELSEKDRTIQDLRDELRQINSLRVELSEKNRTIQELRDKLQTRSSQFELDEKDHTITDLRGELKAAKKDVQRYQAENQRLRDQIEENTHLAESLRFELSVYEHLHGKDEQSRTSLGGASPGFPAATDQATGLDLSELLKEMRHLRIQLERSINTNNALRLRLEEMMKTTSTKSPKETQKTSLTTVTMTTATGRDSWTSVDGTGRSHAAKAFTPRQLFRDDVSRHHVACQTSLTGQATSYLYMSDGALQDEEYYSIPGVTPLRSRQIHSTTSVALQSNGDKTELAEGSEGDIHAIGTLPTYEALRHNLHDGRIVVNLIETRLTELIRAHPESSKELKDVSKDMHKLKSHLDQCNHQLARFWKGRLPQGDQVARLRRRLKEQDNLMKEALERLSTTNRLKEDMELALIQQLSQTHDVLRQARGNLEAQSTNGTTSPLH